jgi:hypothetical protein
MATATKKKPITKSKQAATKKVAAKKTASKQRAPATPASKQVRKSEPQAPVAQKPRTAAGKVAAAKVATGKVAVEKAAAKQVAASEPRAPGATKAAKQAQLKTRSNIEPDRSSPSLAEVDDEVLEFIAAIDDFKKVNGRPFPSWSEVLLVVRQLGYKRG